MPKEERIKRTYSILADTDELIDRLARLTYRGKQHIVDLAVSELAAKVLSAPNCQTVTDLNRSAFEYVQKTANDQVVNEA